MEISVDQWHRCKGSLGWSRKNRLVERLRGKRGPERCNAAVKGAQSEGYAHRTGALYHEARAIKEFGATTKVRAVPRSWRSGPSSGGPGSRCARGYLRGAARKFRPTAKQTSKSPLATRFHCTTRTYPNEGKEDEGAGENEGKIVGVGFGLHKTGRMQWTTLSPHKFKP
jgi:hypothetical protein